MTKLREEKVEKIAAYLPPQKIDSGAESGDLLILGWGSTFGACKSAVRDLNEEGLSVGHAHLRYIKPFPSNLRELMGKFKHVLIPEINNGQLVKVIRSRYVMEVKAYNKIQGVPITRGELVHAAKEVLQNG